MKLTVRATAIKNNFGKYLQHAVENGEVIIEKNGRPVAKLVSLGVVAPNGDKPERVFASDRLLGALRVTDDLDFKAARMEALEKKYGRPD